VTSETREMSDVTTELGSTGLRRSGDYIMADFLPQLNGLSAARVYTEMANNDPLLGGIMFAFEMMLRRVPFKVELPAAVRDTPEGIAVREQTTAMLFTDMQRPFSEVVGEAATMFQYGYAPCEVVYGIDPVQGLVIRKMALRDQQTVARWQFDIDTGECVGMWQQDAYREVNVGENYEVLIPRSRLALFRTTAKLDNPEGRSVLRTSYTTWMKKRVIEEAEARAAVRQAGLVVATVPNRLLSRTASPDEKAQLNSILAVVEAVSSDRKSAVVLPSDVDPESKAPMFTMQYLLADGRRSGDMTPLIERLDRRMAGAVLADFMLLGQQATGSFALGKTKTQLFTLAFYGFVEVFGAEMTGTLKRWWARRGGDPAFQPMLVAGDVEEAELPAIAGFVQALSQVGVIRPDDNLETFLRTYAGLPPRDEATTRELPGAGAIAPEDPDTNTAEAPSVPKAPRVGKRKVR
jgi:hypothetical protein